MFLSSTPPPPVEPQSSGVQRILLFTLLVVVVSIPLLIVSLLYAETYLPALDRFTLAMPMPLRTTVAEGILKNAVYGKDYEPKVRRALKLDPSNSDALTDVCSIETGDDPKPDAIASCKRAIDLDPARYNWSNLAHAQEKAGDVCSAAQSYETAHGKGPSGDSDDLRGMGRTDLQCARIPYSIAELSAARDLDAQYAKNDDDDTGDADEDLKSDNEWLSAAYDASNQPGEAKEACLLAHPAWKTCACVVNQGKVSCTGAATVSAK
jgi:tetratricopeptide (TPR) repeat protein